MLISVTLIALSCSPLGIAILQGVIQFYTKQGDVMKYDICKADGILISIIGEHGVDQVILEPGDNVELEVDGPNMWVIDLDTGKRHSTTDNPIQYEDMGWITPREDI
jgi:hypothetical protein